MTSTVSLYGIKICVYPRNQREITHQQEKNLKSCNRRNKVASKERKQN